MTLINATRRKKQWKIKFQYNVLKVENKTEEQKHTRNLEVEGIAREDSVDILRSFEFFSYDMHQFRVSFTRLCWRQDMGLAQFKWKIFKVMYRFVIFTLQYFITPHVVFFFFLLFFFFFFPLFFFFYYFFIYSFHLYYVRWGRQVFCFTMQFLKVYRVW